ncbi:VUT family protein [Pusillimonas minor]|uniref:Probable queuosine precursor transporter n=1 Tax=Pusillimonas minor TaxID=2697024 RepID=A0A842HL12_9BURK|nr:VUT family protein [Pusillimonas minor]MBC2769439.1 VUT family protein [Pusillimonas minor]
MNSKINVPMSALQTGIAVIAMAIVVVGSNILVQYPINQWLTWGAISYPVAFLVADLINRRFGPSAARRVAAVGFIIAVIFSFWVATPRIAMASGLAFLFAQFLDIHVFDRLRNQAWWRAPFIGGVAGATLDTVLFFSLAFAGTGIDWTSLLVGDLAVKLAVNLALLAPFRALMWNLGRPESRSVSASV